MTRLPDDYIVQMNEILGEETERFLASYKEPRTHGLRLNTQKLYPSDEAFLRMKRLFRLTPVPWCPSGFYYDDQGRPGKHPYHAAGLYYIQEPSAMSVVELLNPRPGEAVLDLAAAPGGKSSQIAGKMEGQGLLIANEIHPARAKILSENIERMGLANCIVTNCEPQQLARTFNAFFDRIMLDAPCSGEGMFRKDPDAIAEWSPDHVRMCAARQTEILDQAAIMLKPGGVLAYSTCTFNRAENEQTLEAFVTRHPEFTIDTVERIWPHRHKGEGHFAAILRRGEGETAPYGGYRGPNTRKRVDRGSREKSGQAGLMEALKLFETFARDVIPGFVRPTEEPLLFGEQLYSLPQSKSFPFHSEMLNGLKVLRPGLHLGTIKKNRIEPAHSLAMAVRSDETHRMLTLDPDEQEVASYLRGESLPLEANPGWHIVAVDRYPIGWGKSSDGQIKNHYPKGLRVLG